LPSDSNQHRDRRLFHESYETLRNNLFLSQETKATRSIAVVSGMTSEGKSSVASQLALSLVRSTDEPVLLVDADMRCPEQHDLFGLEPGQGLGEVLAGELNLTDAIDTTANNKLHVLTSGSSPEFYRSHVTPKNMQALIEEALQQYRYVILDTSPVLSAGESLAIACSVDATLLCVMRDVSRIDAVLRTTQRLKSSGANIVGCVFNGLPAWQYSYRYGTYFEFDNDTKVARAA